ncbi:hypothetical protein HYU14_02760 [Candidatus Woesearchaeota archaeon]|nr:hypothetical protein [Candidatus Woesearchaeota archaeon]
MRKMYGNFFEALQRKKPYGVPFEEWDNFILTALYETLAECGVNISRRALF